MFLKALRAVKDRYFVDVWLGILEFFSVFERFNRNTGTVLEKPFEVCFCFFTVPPLKIVHVV